tara:strand:- start:11104 stop:11823 length:720 start_codon:yes stop_codon:yes gene_type:complete
MEKLPHILVVDDHAEIRKSVSQYLEQNGMQTSCAENASEMDSKMVSTNFDLIILDVMMPGEDGMNACKRLRRDTNIPVLMLTALADVGDRIDGLNVGADDYLSKPFNPKELLARVNAILRRTLHVSQIDTFAGKTVSFAHLELDYDGRILTALDGTRTILTFGELKLLAILLQRPRVVISRDELLKMSTGRTAGPLDRTIDNQISRLRRKIETDVLRPRIIATVRHGGYSLACDVAILS